MAGLPAPVERQVPRADPEPIEPRGAPEPDPGRRRNNPSRLAPDQAEERGLGLEVTASGTRVLGSYPAGPVLVDGKGVGDVGSVVLRDRQLLAEAGMLVIALTIDRTTGLIVAGPEIVSRGFVYMKEADALMDEVKTAVRDALAARREPAMFDREQLGTTVRSAVRRFVNQRFQRKPVVLPVILEV